MRFVSFLENGVRGLAVTEAGIAALLHGFTTSDPEYPGGLDDLLASGADLQAIGHLLQQGRKIDPKSVDYLPPVLKPPKLICVGLNYADHAAETKQPKPKHPELFARFATSLIGHQAPIIRPAESIELDYESELAFIIGRKGRRIPAAQALDYVAGYSVFNDATLRDYQLRTGQWTVGKNFDQTGACGPCLVTPDELPPGASGLRIVGRLNDQVVQESNTRLLMFNVADLISLVSEAMTLEPGDVFITGTPGGVGMGHEPKLWMKDGDRFEVEVEGIGILSNRIKDD